MTNKINITGNFNIVQQDATNSSINIIINKSVDYEQLMGDLKELEENLVYTNPNMKDRINLLEGKILLKKDNIEKFKQEVIRLADIFSKIEINTERLIKAKAYFDDSKFKEANTILKLSDIDKDQNILLSIKEKKEKEIEEINKQLVDNSNEYYVKAQTIEIYNYTSNKFQEIFSLYKRSIKSYSGFNNNYGLASFFMRNQKYHLAEPYFLKALEQKKDIHPMLLSNILNDTGVCLKEQGKYESAEKYYVDSIELKKKYIDNEDIQSIHDLAVDYMNLGTLYCDWRKFDKDLFFLEEAIRIYRKYPEDSNRYLDELSSSLNNIGKHFIDEDNYDVDKVITYLEEALQLRRRTIITESIQYSFRVANILGNLCNAYTEKKRFEDAEKCLQEAIMRYEAYERMGIFSYRVSFIKLLVNGAKFYTYKLRRKDDAWHFAKRALQILRISHMTEIISKGAIISIKKIFSEFDEIFIN